MAAIVDRAFAACGLVFGFIACSSDEGAEPVTSVGTGGYVGTGGFVGAGSAQPSGGVTASSGGGTAPTGGTSPSGGMPPMGGTAGAGGGPVGGGSGWGGMSSGGNPPVPGSGGASPGSGGSGGAGNNLDALRNVCLTTINDYRASLNRSLKPLVRPAASIEACSDQGARSDGTSGVAHASAGKCAGTGSQNTCPGYPPNRTTGVEGALKQCLAQMWAEGEPAEGKAECLRKYFAGDRACFLAHGHYLNMSDPAFGFVACGFYTMPNGRIWMNQDFGR